MSVSESRSSFAVTVPVLGVDPVAPAVSGDLEVIGPLLEAMPAPRVPGFPSEGSWVDVCGEGGAVIATGWFSVDPVHSTPGRASVAVVWREPAFMVNHSYRFWSGMVVPDQVRRGSLTPAAAPAWFGAYVEPVHRGAQTGRELESQRAHAELAGSALSELRVKHERWVEELSADACEWADDNSLCEEFDKFMASKGLAGRERERDVDVLVTVRMTIPVTSRSQEEAEERIDSDDVRNYVSCNLRHLDFDYEVE